MTIIQHDSDRPAEATPEHPFTCEWCRNPADHVAVYDYRPGADAPERIKVTLCGPCGHSITILPASFESWWLFTLAPDDPFGCQMATALLSKRPTEDA